MKMLLITIALVCVSLPLLAEMVSIENSKGTYYEVLRDRDGTYAFYYVPSYDATVQVYGSKAGKPVFGFLGLSGREGSAKAHLKEAYARGLVSERDQVIVFHVDLELVDKLTLEHGFMAPGGVPTGTVYHTDLIWLIDEAKKDGRFRDYQNAEQGADGNRPDATQSPSKH